jgi:hypothetical protein
MNMVIQQETDRTERQTSCMIVLEIYQPHNVIRAQKWKICEDVGFCVGFVGVMLFTTICLAGARITCCTCIYPVPRFSDTWSCSALVVTLVCLVERRFRVAHFGLFLRLAIVFSFHSTIFAGVIDFVAVDHWSISITCNRGSAALRNWYFLFLK